MSIARRRPGLVRGLPVALLENPDLGVEECQRFLLGALCRRRVEGQDRGPHLTLQVAGTVVVRVILVAPVLGMVLMVVIVRGLP